ncbi:fluoride efflux transporter CrcB [Rhodococcus gannanensis]|uniref:Fluoride-specific ion channel FluC n=1 Tax=Rhodococcus gannanensis TaxID=1960308 RepID=A0ABW4P468_9NOCA
MRGDAAVVAAVAVGGALGALARYGVARMIPAAPDTFPWATFTVNVLGCLLIGILLVLVTEAWTAHFLLRPFLGVGVLGGFTTFSTYAVEIVGLTDEGRPVLAFTYLAGTLVAALAAVVAGVWFTRAAVGVAVTKGSDDG